MGQLAQSLKGTLRNGADVVAVDVEELQSAHTLMTRNSIQFNSGKIDGKCLQIECWRYLKESAAPFLPGAPGRPRLGNSIKGKMLRIRLKTTVHLYPFPIYLVCLDIDRKVRRKLITSEGGALLPIYTNAQSSAFLMAPIQSSSVFNQFVIYKKRTTGCCCCCYCCCLSIYTACVHVYEPLLLS